MSQPGSDRPVVLVAEDDPSVRMMIEYVLVDEGFDVLLAEDGEVAIDIALTRNPDAILLDLMMPKLDGKEVLSRLRQSESTATIPVFVLTGMSRSSATEWAGAHFVGKPFMPDELVEVIKDVMARSG
jgi:DNA-binding response OmpR family regulator